MTNYPFSRFADQQGKIDHKHEALNELVLLEGVANIKL